VAGWNGLEELLQGWSGAKGLDWKPGVVARREAWQGKVLRLVNNLPSRTVSLLLEIKRERSHLLDRRGKMKCTYLKSELGSATTPVE